MIKEGPEDMLGYGWTQAEGPFFIFQDQHGKTRWVYGNLGNVIWDDGVVIDVSKDPDMKDAHWNSADTHGPLLYSADMRELKRPIRLDNKKGIKGRVWSISGKLYAGFWNAPTIIKRFPEFLPVFTSMMKKWFPGTKPEDIIIDPNSRTIDPISLSSFKDYKPGRAKNKKLVDLQQKLHILPPRERAVALKKMGIPLKTAANPEWMRKAMAGVDESLVLSKIVKQILTEGKASSFLKFYRDEKRFGDVDDATLFDCLMTLKEYYSDYLRWYNQRLKNTRQLRTEEGKLVEDFKKRLQEINIALQSDDKKRKIVAVDNGINQWHIDFPVVMHMVMDAEDDESESSWLDVADLLTKLGRILPKSPYGSGSTVSSAAADVDILRK